MLLACAPIAFGQAGTSNLVGLVSDPTNAVVPGAVLTATEQATGASQVVMSNSSGLFRFNGLRPGRYSLNVTVPGFKTLELADINLVSSETRDLGKLVMQLGQVTESVTVTAQTTPVQTASSERSATVLQEQLQNLSLKGRDPFSMIQLMPGVVDTRVGNRDVADAYSMGYISINGMHQRSRNVLVDGVTEMDEGGNWSAFVTPNMDSVAEMRVLTNGYQAEYGRQAGGTINVITKGGSKDFHGTGHYNYRHESMNANSFFNNRENIQRALYRYMIAGYSVGGPVYLPRVWNTDRRKVFFFFSQEFLRVAQPTNTITANMPTDLERAGNFSETRNSRGEVIPIKDPLTGKQFQGNIIPASRIDPIGSGMLNLLLKPNGYVNPAPGQQYTANFLASNTPSQDRSNTMLRFDFYPTNKMNFFYRYGRDVDNREYSFVVSQGRGTNTKFMPGQIHGWHMSYTPSPTLVNEVLVGIGHTNYGFYRSGGATDSDYFRTSSLNPPTLRPFPTADVDVLGYPMYLPYLPCAAYSGGQAVRPAGWFPGGQQDRSCSTVPYRNENSNIVIQDDLSKLLGSHSLKAGVFIEYNKKLEPSAGATYYGNFNFGSSTNNPLDTGHGYANALLGVFQTYSEASNRAMPNTYFWQLEWYVQDSWRIKRNFTLELGLRFVNQHPVVDDAGYRSNFYKELWDPAKAARLYYPARVGGKNVAIDRLTGQTTYSALVGTIVPESGSPINGMRVDGYTGKGDFYEFTPVVLAPRLGFAWDVRGNGKTAIRASAGIFYNRTFNSLPGGGSPPVVYTPTIYYSFINQIPQAASTAVYSPTSASAIWGKQAQERAHMFNLTVQQDIGFNSVVDVGYVGNFDRHGSETIQWNPVPLRAYADPANLFNNTEMTANLVRKAYPGMGSISYTSYSNSPVNYHGLQTSLQRRMNRGLGFGVSYTFSKVLGTQGNDPYHTNKWYYGPTGEDRTHVMTWNFAWNLPRPRVNWKGAGAIFDGWTLSGIGIVTTGAPVNPSCSSTAGYPYNDPSLTGGGARCQQVADPKDFTHDFYNNFNTNAFVLAPIGTFGNIGQSILRQPTWWNFDASLEKKVSIRERVAMRFRFQAFNVFNHTEFNEIGTGFSFNAAGANLSTTTGQYTDTQPPRQIAMSVRFEF
jgi:hypothetical protein